VLQDVIRLLLYRSARSIGGSDLEFQREASSFAVLTLKLIGQVDGGW
jgi:hypothetical protein